MIKRLLFFVTSLLFSTAVVAQTARTSTDHSGTIAVTNTFQTVFSANKRAGCTIQNKGAASMWVSFRALADSTKAKSVELTTGQSVTCGAPGVVLSNEVNITGTATQEFFAGEQ